MVALAVVGDPAWQAAAVGAIMVCMPIWATSVLLPVSVSAVTAMAIGLTVAPRLAARSKRIQAAFDSRDRFKDSVLDIPALCWLPWRSTTWTAHHMTDVDLGVIDGADVGEDQSWRVPTRPRTNALPCSKATADNRRWTYAEFSLSC